MCKTIHIWDMYPCIYIYVYIPIKYIWIVSGKIWKKLLSKSVTEIQDKRRGTICLSVLFECFSFLVSPNFSHYHLCLCFSLFFKIAWCVSTSSSSHKCTDTYRELGEGHFFFFFFNKNWVTSVCLNESVEHVTVGLWVVSSGPTLGIELT